MHPRSPLLFAFILGASALLAGCLPGSGQRESRALFPSDSLSREIAEQMPIEPLVLVTRTFGPDDRPMLLPHSIQIGPDGLLYVGDTRRNSIYRFHTDGGFAGEIASESFSHPYMAGARGDSIAVMNRGTDEIFLLKNAEIARRLPFPSGEYVSTLVTDTGVYYKTSAEDSEGFMARLEGREPVTRAALDGPYWRYIGFLREWDEEIISLSGYRPVVDIFRDGSLDTLALVGFDSPMLSRTRQFMRGRISQLPLLSSSARPVGDRLFVLNMRPGWIRVDVYDREGRLNHILEQENPEFDRHLYPLDLEVAEREDGAFDIAIVAEHPAPLLYLYRWTPAQEAVSALPES